VKIIYEDKILKNDLDLTFKVPLVLLLLEKMNNASFPWHICLTKTTRDCKERQESNTAIGLLSIF